MTEMSKVSAQAVITQLELQPHPEGGHYRETYRHKSAAGQRGAVTVIYYLLAHGEKSAWHRIDATEIWHYCAGAPLQLMASKDGVNSETMTLGNDFATGQRGHGVVPANAWQCAKSLGDWTLVSCTVAPAFEFDGFELAPENWSPGG